MVLRRPGAAVEKKKGPRGPTREQKLTGDQGENYKDHRKIPRELAEAIRSARISLKLTQEQLAKQINVRPVIINDIEAQRGTYDHVVIERIKRVLKIRVVSTGSA